MTVNELICAERRFRVARIVLQAICEIFAADSPLLQQPYCVRSRISCANFKLSVEAINGATPDIIGENASNLDALCKEFRFTEFGQKVADFLAEHQPTHSKVNISQHEAAIAQQRLQHGRDIGCLEEKIAEMSRCGVKLSY